MVMMMQKVIVVGGSVAGLATAATLASRARDVVVVERHDSPAMPPQAGLPHAMLLSGAQVLHELFPDFGERLLARGAVSGGKDPTRLPCYWAAAGVVRWEQLYRPTSLTRALCSRELIQAELRACVESLPNVSWCHDAVVGAVTDGGAVRGVRLRSGTTLEADLVVDAGGRAGGVPPQEELPLPPSTEVGVDIRYTAVLVERHPHDFDGAAFAVVQSTPAVPRMGIALPMEGDLWQVGVAGYFGDQPPTDPTALQQYAASLADPVLAPLLGRDRGAAPRRYTFRTGQRRHWERMPRPVPGFVAIGDSVASFNPIYGQGMSSALLQARVLGRLVDRCGPGAELAKAAPRAIAAVVNAPWRVSTGSDYAYPQTEGIRPRGQSRINAYVTRVMRAAAVDDSVNLALTSVQHLLAPPETLLQPAVLARSLRHGSLARASGTPAVTTHPRDDAAARLDQNSARSPSARHR
jgi:flavin-dependent dehydrogenase